VHRGQEAEEEVGAGLGEGDEADLVHHQEVVAQQLTLGAAQAVLGLGLQEQVGQPAGGGGRATPG
jgi:hypothetical protein